MSPRLDPFRCEPVDDVTQRQILDQMANLFKAVAGLADALTAQTGEIVALRHAIDGGTARAENARLAVKRRYERNNNNES